MGANLTFQYDRIGDILTIEIRPPYREQDSDEIGDSVVARFHPRTGIVEGIEVLFLATHLVSQAPFRLDVAIAPGAINGWPAAPEFDCLVQPDSEVVDSCPEAAVSGMELDTRPPKRFPPIPAIVPADISRFALAIGGARRLTG